jgi:hypothetical protein
MTTTSNAINEQSSIFLNLEQMAAAVEYLVTCWPGKQMLPDERESWLDVLCMVHPGELKPALARRSPTPLRWTHTARHQVPKMRCAKSWRSSRIYAGR